jgi:hypothetical protein
MYDSKLSPDAMWAFLLQHEETVASFSWFDKLCCAINKKNNEPRSLGNKFNRVLFKYCKKILNDEEKIRHIIDHSKLLSAQDQLREMLAQDDPQHAALSREVLARSAPVEQPLVLISEVQRSGGSLLCQLFDGHPQVYTHHHELKIGVFSKLIWPEFSPEESPHDLFFKLYEYNIIKHFKYGFAKGRLNKDNARRHKICLPPRLQYDIFLNYLAQRPHRTRRDVLNAYMTSYVNGFLNYGHSDREKKYLVGFTPFLAAREDNVTRFFQDYPDGHIVSVLRDPVRWFASARKHSQAFSAPENATAYWLQSTRAMIHNANRHPGRVHIVRFADLILRNREATGALCGRLGIEPSERMAVPTCNGTPITANSSFQDSLAAGLNPAPVLRPHGVDQAACGIIESKARDLFDQARTHPAAIQLD